MNLLQANIIHQEGEGGKTRRKTEGETSNTFTNVLNYGLGFVMLQSQQFSDTIEQNVDGVQTKHSPSCILEFLQLYNKHHKNKPSWI